jgi:hypothetical protein
LIISLRAFTFTLDLPTVIHLSEERYEMKEQNGSLPVEKNRLNVDENGPGEEPTRAEEQMDVAEPDAPTAAEENAGMSTILGAEPLSGVQDDASDE